MVNIEVKSVYNRFLKRQEPLTKVINVFCNGVPQQPFQIVVGVGYVSMGLTGSENYLTLRGGISTLHRCDIAVVLTHSGHMKMLKNRNGRDSITNDFSIRLTILESLMTYGFNETDACIILGTFNGVVKEFIGPQPMIKYRITKHKLV